VFLGSYLVSIAQSPSKNLEPFYDSYYQPEELNESSKDRINALYEYYKNQSVNTSKSGVKSYEDFVYRNNYFLEKLNKSGEVFYGDEISRYLNQLKDYLLENHPRKKDIKIYLTRHPAFNAFTNDFGNVYVNIASVSKLSSEQELMALLAHEISHVLKSHTHQFEEYRKKVESGDWNKKVENEVLARHVFSQQQEYEADLEGFKLLMNRGVNPNTAVSIFEKLQYDLNPTVAGKCDFALLINNNFLREYLDTAYKNNKGIYKFIKEENANDSLRTHPSTDKRRDKITNLITEDKNDYGAYKPIGDFTAINKLAKWVLINTYIENGWFIESLDLVLKLRKENPKDEYLIKAQAKLALLLTQDKYNATPFSQIINNRGSAYTDTSFLEFKEMILACNAPELNMLSIFIVDELMMQSTDVYLKRIKSYLVQFLYKYNPRIFTFENGKIALIDIASITSKSIKVNTLQPLYNLTKDQKTIFLELTSKKGYKAVAVKDEEKAWGLYTYFLSNYSLTSDDLEYINTYKVQREKFESMLTKDEISITFYPPDVLNKYKKGDYVKSTTCTISDSVALVQTTSLYLDGHYGDYYTNYKKSLGLEQEMIGVFKSAPLIKKNYSNAALYGLTMQKINYHYYLNIWINERFDFNDLIYSTVDEEVEKFKKEQDIRYLLYNINVASHRNIKNARNVTYAYNVFFDLQSEGIPYISKIASREKSNMQVFKQLFYLSNFYLEK